MEPEQLRCQALSMAIAENVRLQESYPVVIEMAKAFYEFLTTGDAPTKGAEIKKAA